MTTVPPRSAPVRLDRVDVRFPGPSGGVTALESVDLRVVAGESVAVVGPSGCGKSTLLRVLAGLQRVTGGTVRVGDGGEPARTSMVFQDHGLLPWLDVADNIALPLEARGTARRRRRALAAEAAGRLGLRGFEGAFPSTLSGGMRQRVGIARAIVAEPALLLMDEPFAALDALTRLRMQRELADLLAALGPTLLYVTHDVGEAVRVADRIVVLSARPGRVIADLVNPLGRAERYGPASDVATADLRWRILDLLGVGRDAAT